MTADEARLVLLERHIKKSIPGFAVRWKNEGKGSGVQKLIGVLMFFNRGYMKDFISTFFPYVYWPSEKDYRSAPRGSFKVLAHEYVHLWDAKKSHGWFSFSYILWHWLALLALGALVAIWASNWWLLFLVALVFALPLPSPWRMKWEYRGYTMSMACNAWKHGDVQETTVDALVEHFISSEYYFMWPFKKAMRRRFNASIDSIHNGDVLLWGQPFKDVKVITDLSDKDAIEAAEKVAA